MKIGFIGSGNMGSALASAAARAEGVEVLIYDKDADKAKACADLIGATCATLETIATECDFIFLGVKPNIICAVADEICNKLSDNATIISMAAGVKIEKIEKHLKANTPIIRIMPNTPVSVGAGMILWCANGIVTEKTAEKFVGAMSAAGSFDKIDEAKIDAASAVSGCGPAFAYMFIEALADGAVECGLPREQAQKYAAQTLLGAAKLVLVSGKHPGELKDAVCSPGGSTIAGVHALEDGAFRASASDAVVAAYERTLELGK